MNLYSVNGNNNTSTRHTHHRKKKNLTWDVVGNNHDTFSNENHYFTTENTFKHFPLRSEDIFKHTRWSLICPKLLLLRRFNVKNVCPRQVRPLRMRLDGDKTSHGGPPSKKDGVARRKVLKEPLWGTKILRCGCSLNFFFTIKKYKF